ncbi:MAG: hypothetical protein JWN44_5454 [Myxococcales bacterium]|nr:hypothetical protein [Myxococcales bacterium]
MKEHQLAVRMPDDLLRLIDSEVERRRVANPGSEISRSDVIRDVLYRNLGPPMTTGEP